MLIEAQCRANQCQLERGGIVIVADEQIRHAERYLIHCSGDRNTFLLMAATPEVLHGREESRMQDLTVHAAASSTNSLGAIARNVTTSPARNSVAGSRLASKSRSGVRPMSCHPPGEASGYTPV